MRKSAAFKVCLHVIVAARGSCAKRHSMPIRAFTESSYHVTEKRWKDAGGGYMGKLPTHGPGKACRQAGRGTSQAHWGLAPQSASLWQNLLLKMFGSSSGGAFCLS